MEADIKSHSLNLKDFFLYILLIAAVSIAAIYLISSPSETGTKSEVSPTIIASPSATIAVTAVPKKK